MKHEKLGETWFTKTKQAKNDRSDQSTSAHSCSHSCCLLSDRESLFIAVFRQPAVDRPLLVNTVTGGHQVFTCMWHLSARLVKQHTVQSRGIGYQLSSKDYNSSSRASCSTRVSCTSSMYWQVASGRHLGAGSREGDNSSPPPPQALHPPPVLPVPAQQAISFFLTQVLSCVPFTVFPAATELAWLTRQPETIANTDNDPPVAPHDPYRKPLCASGEFEQDANVYTRLLGQRRRLDKSSYPVVLHILWFSFSRQACLNSPFYDISERAAPTKCVPDARQPVLPRSRRTWTFRTT
jgi:hypothetical protein